MTHTVPMKLGAHGLDSEAGESTRLNTKRSNTRSETDA